MERLGAALKCETAPVISRRSSRSTTTTTIAVASTTAEDANNRDHAGGKGGQGLSSSSTPSFSIKVERDEVEGDPSSSSVPPPPPCSVPTINFNDFVSLLSPSSVECCLCCSAPLLSFPPPIILPDEKVHLLKYFCDILNLPFELGQQHHHNRKQNDTMSVDVTENGNNEEDDDVDDKEEEGEIDFPFCRHCTNKKVLLLTSMHNELEKLKEQFSILRDAVMQDVIRAFVTNIVVDKKIPVEVIREKRIAERMFRLFKSHSEKRPQRNTTESEVQTDISSVLTPLLNPATVASILENSASSGATSNKKRKLPLRKSENFIDFAPQSPVPSQNDYPLKLSGHRKARSGRGYNYDDDDYSSEMANYSITASPMKHGNNNTQSNGGVEESIVDFDDNFTYSVNGATFSFDDNGVFNFGESDAYMTNDYYDASSKTNMHSNATNSGINGFTTIDGDEFQKSLGFSDMLQTKPLSVSDVELKTTRVPDSSPVTYTDLNSMNPTTSKELDPRFASCEICNKSMLKTTIKMHMEQIHRGEKPFSCRGCDRRFSRKDHRRQHEENHDINADRVYFCHRCMEKTTLITGKSAYISHCVEFHGIEDDIVEYFYFCDEPECRESYKVKEDVLTHLQSHWKLGESHRCPECEKVFATKGSLVAHQSGAHSRKGGFDCSFCQHCFVEEEDFTRHLLFHKVKMPEECLFTCDICEKSCETLNRLRRHKYSVHTRPRSRSKRKLDSSLLEEYAMDSECSGTNIVAEKPSGFPCDKCKKTYTSEKRLEKHKEKRHPKKISIIIRKNHTTNVNASSSEEDIPDAGEIDTLGDDEEYMDSSKPKKRRGRSSRNKESTVDTSTFPNSCEHCPSRFKTIVELRRHSVNSHRSLCIRNGRVWCVVCFTLFDSKEELDLHCKQRHSKFRCSICDKQCQNTLILKQHLERHKASSYSCKLCDQGFGSKAGLKLHCSKVHGISGSKKMNGEKELPNILTPSNNSVDFVDHDDSSYDLSGIDLFQM